MVFYRKYRPQSIRELDSETVRDALSLVLSAKSVPHAFLFVGEKGLGKTSAARIVAKAVNCSKKRSGIEPCNHCTQCTSITQGTNLDVLEIDGASHRGIDEVRDLREKVRLSALSARKKVYIIDEVHMLTTEAFNALLKTLEEPPPHVLFVLATTEPQKVPPTIVSRCFQVAFPVALETDLVRSLKRMVKGEKLKIDEEALSHIAKLSDGNFRDAAKILEELLAKAGRKKITRQMLEERYKVLSVSSAIQTLLGALALRDVRGGLLLVEKLVGQGVDMKYFLEELTGALHGMLLGKVGVINHASQARSDTLSVEQLKDLTLLFTRAYGELKYAVMPQLPLELAIVEWTVGSAGCLPHAAEAARQSQSSEQQAIPSSLSERRPPQSSTRSNVKSGSAFSSSAGGQAPSVDNVRSMLIEKIKSHNHSIAGVLRGCRIQSLDGKHIIIETKYKFHKDKLSEEKTHALIENTLGELVGEGVLVSVQLRGGERQ